MERNSNRAKIMKMTTLAILVATVLLFQFLGSFIKIGPTSITLVLVPIVLGGILLGPSSGAFLGLIFGAMTLWAGISGTDAFTNILFTSQPYATTAICIGKAVLAGFIPALAYRAVSQINKIFATFLAAALAPVVNTGVFVLGALFLVNETLTANLGAFGAEGMTLVYFVIIGCAGFNFIGELIANLILSPVITTVTDVVSGMRSKH